MLGVVIFIGILALAATISAIVASVLSQKAHKEEHIEAAESAYVWAIWFAFLAVLSYLVLAVCITDLIDGTHADMVKAAIIEEICEELNISKDSVTFTFEFSLARADGYSDIYNVVVSTEPVVVYQALYSKSDIKLIRIGD